jgi:hypothetical protein
MPRDGWPRFTAFSAYSIWSSLPDGLNVVKLNEYAESAIYQFSEEQAVTSRENASATAHNIILYFTRAL